jgi:hypothetical protein
MTPITNNVHHQEDSLSYLLLQEIDSAAGCYLEPIPKMADRHIA